MPTPVVVLWQALVGRLVGRQSSVVAVLHMPLYPWAACTHLAGRLPPEHVLLLHWLCRLLHPTSELLRIS